MVASRRRARFQGAAATGLHLLGRRLRTKGAIVLAYHDIGDDPGNETTYYLGTAQLRRQLLQARRSLRLVSLGELTSAFLSGADLDGLGAVVFDDALAGVHHHAMPLLLELGIPAAVFCVSSEMGRQPAWWPGAARVMTAAEVAEVAAAGLTIASHTRTHRSLTGLAGGVLGDEVHGSRAELEDLISAPVDLFAYPYGHYDPAARAVVERAGYVAGYSFLNGRITAGLDAFRLPRLNMWSGQGRLRLAYHLARAPRSWPETQLEAVTGPDEVLRTVESTAPPS